MNMIVNVEPCVIARVDQITPAWLTDALRQTFLDANERVVRCKAVQIGIGEGFAGRLYRLSVTFDKRKPVSLIAKLASDDPSLKNVVAIENVYREARFYKEIAPRIDVATPKVFYANYGDEELVIIMEDLGEIDLGSAGLMASVAETKVAFSTIAKFHVRWWNHDITREDWLAPAGDSLEKEELDRALRVSLDKYGDQFPYLGECIEIFLKHLPKIPMVIAKKPPLTLIHGDFHRKNLHFKKDGSVTIFDWQVVEANTPVTDIANWLLMYLSVEDRRTHEVKLLRHYYKSLGRKCRRKYKFRQLKSDYRQALIPAIIRMFMVLEMIDLDIEGGDKVAPVLLGRIEEAAMDHKMLDMFKSMWVLVWITRIQRVFGGK